MSYALIVEELENRLRTVAGVMQVIAHEPASIDAPTIISVLQSFERSSKGQITTMIYLTVHTLALRWTENEQAERELRSFVNSVCAAIDTDPQLGSTCAYAAIVSGSTGFATISGVEYRILDFISEVTEKRSFQSGI
jgi:hypothetical protein